MATFGPARLDETGAAQVAPPAFAAARLLILQRVLATLTHELGNMTSPVSLIADAISANPSQKQQTSAAGTLRVVADSLRHTTAICRLLRGKEAASSFAPTTFTDTAHCWRLLQPYIADMLHHTTRLHGEMAVVPIAAGQYEPVVWATMAAALFANATRPTSTDLTVTGTANGPDGSTLIVQLETHAPRSTPVPRLARELKRLAGWEAARAGGGVQMASFASRLVTRITIPPSPD